MRRLSLTVLLFWDSLVLGAGAAWETVDTFPAGACQIYAGQDSHLWTVARVSSAEGTNIVRHSADSGASWTTVSRLPGSSYRLASDQTGRLYVFGTLNSQGVVFRSDNHGASWTQVLSFTSSTTGPAAVRGIAFDGSSNAFVVVPDYDADTRPIWNVLKGIPNAMATDGISWAACDRYTGNTLSRSYALVARPSALVGSPAEIFVGGLVVSDLTQPSRWAIRKSLDSGATWTTVNSYQITNNSGLGDNRISGMAVDGAGALYAVGEMGDSTSYCWLVRKSVDGGMTWTNVDYLSRVWPNALHALAVAADAFGQVVVVGYESAGGLRWRSRRSSDGGKTWASEDDFFPAGATGSIAYGVTIDAFGNVFVAGRVDTSISSSAYVRKLPGPPRLVSKLLDSQLIVSWPTNNATGFLLQSASTLMNGGDWSDTDATPEVINGQNNFSMEASDEARFFRLRRP